MVIGWVGFGLDRISLIKKGVGLRIGSCFGLYGIAIFSSFELMRVGLGQIRVILTFSKIKSDRIWIRRVGSNLSI